MKLDKKQRRVKEIRNVEYIPLQGIVGIHQVYSEPCAKKIRITIHFVFLNEVFFFSYLDNDRALI